MGLSDLITHEDPYHIHKSLGGFVIAHYFYQFIYYYHYQTMELTFINMLPHLLLHISSFVFRVLHNRMLTEKLAMFIWEELRLHSMIFAYRSCFSILLPSYRVFFVFLTMAMGGYFLYGQAVEWSQLEFGFTSGTFGGMFYLLTGFHGLHVFTGILLQLIVLLRSFIPGNFDHGHFGINATSLFWHFVDVIWIVLFLLIYVWQ